jgi:hypothetical protein
MNSLRAIRLMKLLMACVVLVTGMVACGDDTAYVDTTITVMTRNVYHGVNAEFANTLTSTDQTGLFMNVASVYDGYFARDFPERAEALAAEIQATRPALVGLQEAVMISTQSPADGSTTPATDVELDYVQILLDALSSLGLQYEVVAVTNGIDLEMPSAYGFDMRHTDREVILARSDLPSEILNTTNSQTGYFATNCQLPSDVVGTITLTRSWASVDVEVNGKGFRFLSTHLDGDCLPYTSAIQEAQAAELLAGPGATDLPLVLVGDLNSKADGTGTTYNNLMDAGFMDAWNVAGIGNGYTYGQADDLRNETSTLTDRIDFVLINGTMSVLDAWTVGADPLDRTPSGLWPSDHAGVVATLGF